MLDKKQIKQDYKNRPPEIGVYCIKNTKNGKVWLCSIMNLTGKFNRDKFTLAMGSHKCQPLQKDWKEFGESAFTFEVLEKLPVKDDPAYDYDEDLKILELMWVEKFRPLSEKTYNENENIRSS